MYPGKLATLWSLSSAVVGLRLTRSMSRKKKDEEQEEGPSLWQKLLREATSKTKLPDSDIVFCGG